MISECRNIAPLLAGAVDDSLNDEQWEILGRHMESCESCRLRLEQDQEIALKLEGLEPRFLERDIWSTVKKTLPKEARAKRVGWTWLIGIVALGILFKPVDLFLAGEWGLMLRLAAFLAIVFMFALAKENPFHLASDAELGIMDEATQMQGV
jgi:hypothetical protein